MKGERLETALVTGGGGFIGSALAKRLTALGVATTVVGRRRYPWLESLGVRCLRGDIRDARFMSEAASGQNTVFHVAALAGIWGDREAYMTTNVQGTENVIAACRKQRVGRLVYTSTPSVVFDGKAIRGGDESMPYSRQPLCPYVETKIIAERLVLAADSSALHTAALRPHLVWGPGDTNLIPRLLERGRSGHLRIVGSGSNRVDISYIDNVVDAHVLAAENLTGSCSAKGQAFFISQGKPVLLWPWINGLFERLDLPRVTGRISLASAICAGWLLEKLYHVFAVHSEPRMTRFLALQLAHDHWFSVDKAQRLLGYEPRVSTRQGMEYLISHLKEESEPAKCPHTEGKNFNKMEQ